MSEFSPYQQKVIKRYYDNLDTVALQRLAELVSELYLAKGKKLEIAWKQAASHMQKLGLPQTRIDHLVKQASPQLVASLVTELQSGPKPKSEIRNPKQIQNPKTK
jgi:hypothetical protein